VEKRRKGFKGKKGLMVHLLWKLVRKTMSASIIPFIPYNPLRIALYKLLGYKIGRQVFIGMMTYLDDTFPELITIEDYVRISYRVIFATHGRFPTRKTYSSPIILKKGCYIGTGAIILSGVTVGESAIVGAGAVVTRNVERATVVAGNPARPIPSSTENLRKSIFRT